MHVRQSDQAVPLAAATIAAAIPAGLHPNISLIDAYPEDSDEGIIAKIKHQQPDSPDKLHCISFSLYVWNRQRILTLAQCLRHSYPTAALVIGGPEATACQQELSELQLFDAVIAGEGELALPAMIAALLQTKQSTTLCPAATPALNMNDQVSPWLSGMLHPQHGVLWETARGCPFNCAFCFDARGSDGVREIPAQRLEQELQLFDRQQVGQIWVLDSTFNFPAQRGKRLLRLMLQHAPQCHYHLEAKAEFLDEETIELLQQIRCSVQVGLQSAKPEVLRHINRSLDVATFSAKVSMLSAAGVTFGIDLIYGLPSDDLAGLRHSINFALQFYPNQVEIFPLALLPGTKLHANKDQYGLCAQPEAPYSVISSASMSAEQLLQCEKLAAATTLFYNTGRAMAYFLPLCQAVNLSAVEFIEQFAQWLTTDGRTQSTDVGCVDWQRWWQIDWSAPQALQMQRCFVPQLFAKHGVEHLSALALDIIDLHSCWSDTMIGAETVPNSQQTAQLDAQDLLNQPWQMANTVTIKQFTYPVDELSTIEDIDLIELYETLQPHASTGLFLRRGEEVFCESIDDIFATLLSASTGNKTPKQIFAPFSAALSQQECLELLKFGLEEGLLVATTASTD